MKHLYISRIWSSHLFFLKLAWRISRQRVFWEFTDLLLSQLSWLFYGAVATRVIVTMLENGRSFPELMAFLWITVLLSVLLTAEKHYVKHLVRPVTDAALNGGINELLYEKACLVDLKCFENSDFYNEYMMALSQAQSRLPEVLHNIAELFCTFLTSIAAFWMIFSIDRYAILFAVFPILGNFVFNGLLNSRIFAMDRENVIFQRMIDYVNRTVHLSEYAREIRLTNVFALLKQKYSDAVSSIQAVIDRYSAKNMVLFWLFQYFTFTLLFELSMIYAGYRTLESGTMTFPEMIVFQSIMHTCTWNILYFSESSLRSVKDSLYIEQIQSFLAYEPVIPEDADGILPERVIRSIEFSHVSFSYGGKKVLREISFTLTERQTLALVGSNGAGKSTLVKLLLRFYDPDEGQIFVNGIDIRRYRLKEYRELFSCAFQDGVIFADTIRENVLMGRHTDASDDTRRTADALALAGLHMMPESGDGRNHALSSGFGTEPTRASDAVSASDRKYAPARSSDPNPDISLAPDTMLTREFDSHGFVPSGGQIQKIVAARAFAKDAPIAVFDEPSSALDPIAEYELFEHIMEAEQARILIFISHRLSSVQNADCVFLMEHGRITERGTHLKLMEQNGAYAALYRIQAKNYQGAEEGDEDYRGGIFSKHLNRTSV